MTLTVLVERLNEQTYRAETTQPVVLSTEGGSRDEAVQRLCDLAERRLRDGEVIRVSIPELACESPWTKFAGIWKNHPDLDGFLGNIADHRREIDSEELAG